MAVSRELEKFREYLEEFGLADSSLSTYVDVAKRALAEKGWMARLKDDDLAPKTKRLIRAAARHWADWKRDDKLRESLKRLRLPAPLRKTAKAPLARKDLFRVMDEISNQKRKMPPAVRAVLGLMAYRGFRDGDCLRMKKSELQSALQQGTLAYEAKGRRRLEFAVIRTYRPWVELMVAQPGRWTRVDELVAPTSRDARTRRATAARYVQRALAEIGADLGLRGLHPHQLRRTYAVQYLKAQKNNPEALPDLVSHMQWASVTTAMEYVNYSRGAERDRVAETMFDR